MAKASRKGPQSAGPTHCPAITEGPTSLPGGGEGRGRGREQPHKHTHSEHQAHEVRLAATAEGGVLQAFSDVHLLVLALL